MFKKLRLFGVILILIVGLSSPLSALELVDGEDQASISVASETVIGIASFKAADFDVTAGNVAIDYTNGQAATNAVKGFATAAQNTALELATSVENYAASPMVVTGGAITEGTTGTFTVAALTALLRTTDSLTGALAYVTLAEQANQVITAADTVYYVCLDYNNGTPQIVLSTTNPYDRTTAPDRTQIPIGSVMKDSSDNVHFISGGFNFQDGVRKLHVRDRETGGIELVSGSAIAYSGTNNFTMAAGTVYAGVNKFSLDSYNSASTQFTAIYDDGANGWTEAERNTIDYTKYDDGDGTLGNVGVAKYGVFWVRRHVDDSHVYVQYGTDSYSLAAAEAALVPSLCACLDSFSVLVGKIIAPQAGGSFTLIQMVTDEKFTAVTAANHANLSNLDKASSGHTGFAGEDVFGTAIGTGLILDSTTLKAHAALQSIVGLTEADVSIIEQTGADTYNVVTSGGNDYLLGSTSDNTSLEFKTPAGVKADLGLDYETVWIPAGAFIPTTTNGAATGSYEFPTQDNMVDYLAFDTTTEEYAAFNIVMDEAWDRSTIKVKFYWVPGHADCSANDTVEWQIAGQAISDDDALDVAMGDAGEVITDTVLAGEEGDLHITGATPSVTVGGTPALADMVHFKVSRNVAGTDDMTEDAWLLGVLIQYQRTNVTAGW